MSEIIEVQEALRRLAALLRDKIAILPSPDAICTIELAADAMDRQRDEIEQLKWEMRHESR